jgi:hypothetical protein
MQDSPTTKPTGWKMTNEQTTDENEMYAMQVVALLYLIYLIKTETEGGENDDNN